jgi:hypothetical protein
MASIFSDVDADAKKVSMGVLCEIAGGIAFLAGAVQLFHHAAIAGCVVGGAVVFLAGKRIREKAA